jgi:BCD family chlorophyll transporter-like MFS transporter
LGVANGSFSIAAIATMMRLATQGGSARRHAHGFVGCCPKRLHLDSVADLGTAASDIARLFFAAHKELRIPVLFGFETVMFVAMSAGCAVWVGRYDQKSVSMRQSPKVVGLTKELSHEY